MKVLHKETTANHENMMVFYNTKAACTLMKKTLPAVSESTRFQRNSKGNQEGKSARGRGVGPSLLLLLLTFASQRQALHLDFVGHLGRQWETQFGKKRSHGFSGCLYLKSYSAGLELFVSIMNSDVGVMG